MTRLYDFSEAVPDDKGCNSSPAKSPKLVGQICPSKVSIPDKFLEKVVPGLAMKALEHAGVKGRQDIETKLLKLQIHPKTMNGFFSQVEGMSFQKPGK